MTWLAVLGSLYKQTYSRGKPGESAEQWRYYIGSALRRNRIEWVLGHSRGTITATIAQRVLPSMEKSSLAGWAMELHPGSLKRSAVMSEIARESKRHKAKSASIDFGCKFPLSGGLPADLERGFTQLLENSGHMKAPNPGLTNHYKKAHRLLEALQGKPEIDLLCILALTVGMTSDMVIYNVPKGKDENETAGFAIAGSKVKHKRGGRGRRCWPCACYGFSSRTSLCGRKPVGRRRRRRRRRCTARSTCVRQPVSFDHLSPSAATQDGPRDS
jgi:hypothetical protein